MNKGLKTDTKQISNSLGNGAIVNINLREEDSNLIVTLPLMKTNGKLPIELTSIYNYQDRNNNGLFGKGTRCNIMPSLTNITEKYYIKNADGTCDIYNGLNVKNKENQLKVVKEVVKSATISRPGGNGIVGPGGEKEAGIYGYRLIDEKGNYYEFAAPNSEYPTKIYKVEGGIITITKSGTMYTLSNDSGCKVTISKETNEVTLKYKEDSCELYKTSVILDDNENIKQVLYYVFNKKEYILCGNIVISNKEGKYIISDEIGKESLEYTIVDNKVISYKRRYEAITSDSDYVIGGENVSSNLETNIKYMGDKTTIECDGKEKTIYFLANGYPTYEVDHKNRVIEYKYDNSTRKILRKSSEIDYSIERTLAPTNLETYSSNGVVVKQRNNTEFMNTISKIYRVEGTGILRYSIPIRLDAGQSIVLSIFGKELKKYEENSRVKITLENESDYFDKEELDGNYDLITLGYASKNTVDHVTIEIELTGNQKIDLCGLKVMKKEIGTKWSYDNEGHVSSIFTSNFNTSMTYDEDGNMSSRQAKGQSKTKYEYCENELTKAYGPYGVVTEITKSLNEGIEEKTTKLSCQDKSYTIKERRNSKGEIVSKADENNNETSYTYDTFGNVKNVTDVLSNSLSFLYNDYKNIKTIMLTNSSKTYANNKEYDEKQRITKIKMDNGSEYEFKYDSHNNIRNVKLDGKDIYSYEYDMTYDILTEIEYGTNGDKYQFIYDREFNLVQVRYKNNYESKFSTKYEYQYKDNKLWKVIDKKEEEIKEYEYDDDERIVGIIKTNSKVQYSYDNNGKLSHKKNQTRGKTVALTYCEKEMSKDLNPLALYDWMYSNKEILATMFEAGDAKLKSNVYSMEQLNPKNGSNPIIKSDVAIPCAYVGAENKLSYELLLSANGISGCVGFWFYADRSDKYTTRRYLFSVVRPEGYGKIEAYIGKDKKIHVDVCETNKTSHIDFIVSDSKINIDKWNFFAIDFIKRNDGIGYQSIFEIGLTLNCNTKFERNKTADINLDLGQTPVYNIGGRDNSSKESLNKYITGLFVGRNREINTNIIDKYYQMTKDYLIENEYYDTTIRAVDYSEVNLHTSEENMLNGFEIIPLQNTFESINGQKPIKCNIQSNSALDLDRTFKYNSLNKRYCYMAYGNDLEYETNIRKSGTLIAKVCSTISKDKQYIFDMIDTNGQRISLVKNKKGLYIGYNEQLIQTSITNFTDNSWHTIGISFDETGIDEVTGKKNKIFRVYFDGKYETITKELDRTFQKMSLSVGKAIKSERQVHELGPILEYYPFNGQMEMLVIGTVYYDQSLISKLALELNDYTKVTMYDQLGVATKVEVNHGDRLILSNTYVDNDSSENEYTLLKNEIIKYENTSVNRKYIANKAGMVKSITDEVFGNKNYSYDSRGYLIGEDDIRYSYDENGNILKRGTSEFKYDKVLKDRLIYADGKNIKYESSNPLNPTSYGNRNFRYEGRKLIYVGLSDEYDYLDVYYKYNDEGLITQKQVVATSKSEDSEVENNYYYYYDGNRLVTEIKPHARIDYLYDEYGELYGFIQENNTKYFYIKDQLKNILGVVDSDGKIVVKYDYDAYGNLKKKYKYTNTVLYDSFRYKGYYWDDDVKMYYCKSRFYVPEWCRWLNADSLDYLEDDSAYCANLFCYCNNNPVMYSDGSGHVAILATLLALGMGALIGASVGGVASIISQSLSNDNGEINWKQVGLDAFFGGVSGLVSCSGIGVVGSVIFGGVWSGLQSIADDKINGNDVNWLKAGTALLIGGIGGAIAGSGSDVANNLGRYSASKAFINAGHNSVRKNLMYAAKISAVKSTFIWGAVRYSANVAFSTSLSTHLSNVFEW